MSLGLGLGPSGKSPYSLAFIFWPTLRVFEYEPPSTTKSPVSRQSWPGYTSGRVILRGYIPDISPQVSLNLFMLSS